MRTAYEVAVERANSMQARTDVDRDAQVTALASDFPKLRAQLVVARERLESWACSVEQEFCCSGNERRALSAECDESAVAIDAAILALRFGCTS